MIKATVAGVSSLNKSAYRRTSRIVGYPEVGKLSLRFCVGIVCQICEDSQIRRGIDLTCGR